MKRNSNSSSSISSQNSIGNHLVRKWIKKNGRGWEGENNSDGNDYTRINRSLGVSIWILSGNVSQHIIQCIKYTHTLARSLTVLMLQTTHNQYVSFSNVLFIPTSHCTV